MRKTVRATELQRFLHRSPSACQDMFRWSVLFLRSWFSHPRLDGVKCSAMGRLLGEARHTLPPEADCNLVEKGGT